MLLRETLFVRLFSLRVPVLLFLGPRVERLDEERCEVSIPLRWRSRNHVGSTTATSWQSGQTSTSSAPSDGAKLAARSPIRSVLSHTAHCRVVATFVTLIRPRV